MIKFVIDGQSWTVLVPEGYTSKGRLAWKAERPGVWAYNLAGKDRFILATCDRYNSLRKNRKQVYDVDVEITELMKELK